MDSSGCLEQVFMLARLISTFSLALVAGAASGEKLKIR